VAGLVRASHYVLTHGSRGSLTTTLIRRPPEPTVPTTGARVVYLPTCTKICSTNLTWCIMNYP